MNYNEFKENGWLAPVSAVRNGEWTDGRIIETLWDYREDEVNPSPGRHPASHDRGGVVQHQVIRDSHTGRQLRP